MSSTGTHKTHGKVKDYEWYRCEQHTHNIQYNLTANTAVQFQMFAVYTVLNITKMDTCVCVLCVVRGEGGERGHIFQSSKN